MNLLEVTKAGLRIARTSRSLWLYGFFVGLGTSLHLGDWGSNNPSLTTRLATHAHSTISAGGMAVLVIAIIALLVACACMYFVSQGALIEGVAKLRQGKAQALREGWRDGLAHCGVLFRITVTYLAVSVASVIVLATPFLLALRLSGTALAAVLAIPAVLIAVPWLVTLYMWQEFAARIAVLENRRAFDAIGKARLFLHGRLLDGLRLVVASILGRLMVVIVGALVILLTALAGFLLLKLLGLAHAAVPVIALGAVALLPMAIVLVAISGTAQSSIWTLGYLTQEGK